MGKTVPSVARPGDDQSFAGQTLPGAPVQDGKLACSLLVLNGCKNMHFKKEG